MARKTTKSPSKSKKKAKDSPGLFTRLRDAWDTTLAGLAHVMDHAGRIGAATLILATAILWIVGSDDLQARVAMIRAEPPTVELDIPDWANESLSQVEPFIAETMQDFARYAQDIAGEDPFDHAAIEKIRSSLEATGWFRSGPTVRRLPGNIIRITGEWRAPAAIVEQSGTEYLVGLDAVRMRLPKSAPIPGTYMRIRDPYMPAPHNGAIWTGGDVEDALLLLGHFVKAAKDSSGFRHEDIGQIESIDLRRYVETGSRSLSLLTRRGATLVWGSVPGPDGPMPGEVGYQTRLERVAMFTTGSARSEAKPGRTLVLNGEAVTIDEVPSGGG